MRVGLGCMRLSTEPERDEPAALATIARALDGGVVYLDTARAYGLGERDAGHNERLVREAVAASARRDEVKIVTKCGMARPGGRWQPDGRARTILEDARASAEALGGKPPDLLLLHAPDPKVPLASSLRALDRARREGLARAVGLSNVSRKELEEAMKHVEIGAVQVALGAYDDAAARGGVVALCAERGIVLFAHSPLGGPSRAARLSRDPIVGRIAERRGSAPAEIVLAYLLTLSPVVVPLVGARSPARVESALAASRVALEEDDLAELDARFPGLSMARRPPRAAPATAAKEVVVLMGISGAGKSTLAEDYVARGFTRLNRDAMGGTLAGVARRLEALLRAGTERVVLDNTYVTRTQRSEIVRVAQAASAKARCVFVETPLHEAQTNVVLRMLERHGELLGGADLARRAKGDPGLVLPRVLSRMARELERPTGDEGWTSLETIPFRRSARSEGPGAAVPLDAVAELDGVLARLPAGAPILVFAWREGAPEPWIAEAREATRRLAESTGRVVELGVCTHAGGPPTCWCRPPLPGLWLAFARRHGLGAAGSVVVATSPAHRTMGDALGVTVIDARGR